MKTAIVTLWGKYKHPIKIKDNMTYYDMAMAISLAVHKKEGKTKFTGNPRSFNYIYECLLRKSCLNLRLNSDNTTNKDTEMLNAANELNNKSEWYKVGDHYERQSYRLGYTQSNILIIDVMEKISLMRLELSSFMKTS